MKIHNLRLYNAIAVTIVLVTVVIYTLNFYVISPCTSNPQFADCLDEATMRNWGYIWGITASTAFTILFLEFLITYKLNPEVDSGEEYA